jgi:hypothetical protein
MPKENVVSFRLDEEKFDALKKRLERDKPAGVNSTSQLARKIVDDTLAGRLVYKNQAHAKEDVSYLATGS